MKPIQAVIPAKAGIHDVPRCWIPAFAGMTASYRKNLQYALNLAV